jgi:MFS transporter, OFA family, oxalate/formate antiporter
VKRIFFGWYIVAATLTFLTFNSTLFVYGFTAFLNPVAETYGWTFAQISLAGSLRGLETGVLDPFVGMMADRWKARKLVFAGILLLTGGIIVFSLASNLIVFYLGFILVGLGGSLGVSMVPTTVISRWFRKNMGKASGILAAGIAMGGLFAPFVVKGIDAFGWQRFVTYVAIGILVIGLPLSFVFRNRPQDYGLVPDGKVSRDDKNSGAPDGGMTRNQALKTRTFWFFGISMLLSMGAINSVAIHQIPYLTSLGMTRSSAALAVTIFSGVSIAARIMYGVLADILPKKNVLAISFAITTAGLLMFEFLDGSSFTAVAFFAVIYGIGAGGTVPLRAPIVREYFGVKNFGSIFGVVSFLTTFGGIACSPITGWWYDSQGTYNPIWLVYAGFTAAATVLVLLLPRTLTARQAVPAPTDA